MTVICYNCRDRNSDQARFCKLCRTQLRCVQCDTLLKPTMRFCPKCGTTLNVASPTNPTPVGQTFVRAMAPGDCLQNRYTILRPLGKGGMGAVYLVEDARIARRQLALKEMSEQGIDPAEAKTALEAFKREAQLLAQLDHANLPKVIDSFSERNRHYLVMEYVPGKTLEKRLAEAGGALPEREVYGYAVQLCDVLDYLHRQQPPIIFRDLKPANIMLKPDGRVKLIDFGIARHFKPGQSNDTQAMGTPGYAAPEQYGKGQSDARTDIYALGATLHHAITGRDPGQEPFNFPAVRALNRTASAPFEAAIMKAVQIDRGQRWTSIAALRAGLDTNVLTPPPVVVTAPPISPVIPPPKPAPGPQTPSTTQAATFKRASFWQFMLLTVGIGAWLASPLTPLTLVKTVVGAFGVWFVSGAIGLLLSLLFVYLLTHQPLSTVVVVIVLIVISSLIPSAYFGALDFSASGPLFLVAGALEFMLLLSGWRTRSWLGLSVIALIVIALSSMLGLFFLFDLTSIVQSGIVTLVGVAAILLISSLVNRITGVGR
ncbi:MAG: protein kinase [Caldilinea sp.]|nr:protein kinase [Caldilinea sp.]